MLTLATYSFGDALLSVLEIALFFAWLILLFYVFADIFRSHDLKGWAKAAWLILVIIFPLIGILAYFIFRGDKMRAHQVQAVADQESMVRHLVQHAAGGHQSKTDELARLAELRDRGDVSADEFQQLKSEILNRQ